MPRKASPKGDAEPVVRRVSARIAAAPKPPPPTLEKTNSKTPKRGASQKAAEELKKTLNDEEQPEKSLNTSTEVNGDPASTDEAIINKLTIEESHKDNKLDELASDEPAEKKAKIDEPVVQIEKGSTPDMLSEAKTTSGLIDSKIPNSDELNAHNDLPHEKVVSSDSKPALEMDESPKKTSVPDESEFVVIKPSEVPQPNEVKEAIDAQGEDGSLLVGFVQIPKDEVISHDSEDVQKIANGINKCLDSAKSNGNGNHEVNGTAVEKINEPPSSESKQVLVDSAGDESKELKSDHSLVIDEVEVAANGTS